MESRKNRRAAAAAETTLTHLDEHGRARMVDVAGKTPTQRTAIAAGELIVSEDVMKLIASGKNPKGDVFQVARIAGITAAKRTDELIPLCHTLPLSKVDLSFQVDRKRSVVTVTAEASAFSQTGVEMEALTTVSVALLTLYDMLKSADKRMVISNVRLLEKQGGKSGPFKR